MNLLRLVRREMLHRRLGLALGIASASVAVACLVASQSILRKHDARTEQLISAREAETARQMAALEDDTRKLMLKMGFNILILPKDQKLSDLYAEDFASHTMPEAYATRLAQSRVATINHILPSLQQKVKWPEHNRTVLVMGVRGEVYIQSAQQKPLLEAVAPGTIVLGSELGASLSLKAGARARFMGREFTVSKVNAERGTKDDITVWMDLTQAQELLGKPGLINGILALDCTCDTVDRLGRIRPEIARILPDTQVIEYASQAVTRAETRHRAAAEARATIQREKEGRAALRKEREALVAVLVPIVMAASALWIGLLALANVRERRTEIGLLRALGLRAHQILLLILSKALVIGVAGAMLGYAGGRIAGMLWRDGPGAPALPMAFLDPVLLGTVLVAAPLLAALASWLPAVLASQEDPAVVLRDA
jgi:ABC-type lipoprotein release transport system permease subunit